MKLVPLSPSHAQDAARLHMAGQPGTFLTSLGADLLTALYRALPQTAVGFGYAVVDEGSGYRQGEEAVLLGFISATSSIGTLFIEIGTRHFLQFVPSLVRRYLQQPSLLFRSFQTILYPFTNTKKGEVNEPSAELLSIMVEPPMRSQGVGEQLLQALFSDCQGRAIKQLDVTVDAQNVGAQRFYRRYGFEQQKQFALYGREMHSYRKTITT